MNEDYAIFGWICFMAGMGFSILLTWWAGGC